MRRATRSVGRRVAAFSPALILGLAAGFAGGVWAAGSLDTTPYGETDLNTASRQARQEGSAEGWEKAERLSVQVTARLRASSAERVDAVERKLTETRQALKDMEKTSADQRVKLTQLQSALAETTAALNNTRNAPSAGNAAGQAVKGTLRVTSVLGRKDKPWPDGCAEQLQSYQVRVTAGTDATVATARLVDAEATRRERQTALTLICDMTYDATLPTPVGDGYRLVVVDESAPDKTLVTRLASGSALAEGSAPLLKVVE